MKFRLRHLAIGLGLIFLMTFLFIKTNVVDSDVHNRFSDDLRSLKMLDAEFGKDVLESRFGLATNYDLIQTRIGEIDELTTTLKNIPGFLQPDETGKIASLLAEFKDLQTRKEDLVQRFKSKNAILNNSLRYFPTAADKLRTSSLSLPLSPTELSSLDSVEHAVFTYSLMTNPESHWDITANIENLEQELVSKRPNSDLAVISGTLSHALTIVKLKPEVDDLVKGIISLPSAEKAENIIEVYDLFYSDSMKRSDVYGLILYVCSLGLLTYIAFIIIRLKTATSSLEYDLAERTRSQLEREVVSEVMQGMATTSDLDELLGIVHRSLGKILNVENCYVALYDSKTDLLSVPFCIDKFDTPAGPTKMGTGLTAYVLKQNEPLLVNKSEIHLMNELGKVKIVGTVPAIWLGVPLTTPEGIVGAVVVQHYENEKAYDQRDARILAAVGDQIALAIERKRVEEVLKTSEEQHRLIVETNPHPVLVFDLETLHFLAVNQAAVKYYGYSRDEFDSTMTLKDLSPAELSDECIERLRKSRNGQDIVLEASKHVTKNGAVLDIELTQHVSTFAGRKCGIVRVNDVTKRLRLETESAVISEIIQGVASTDNLDELLQLIHRSIGRVLYAENCFVALHDHTTDHLSFEFWADQFDPVPAPGTVGKSFTNYVLRSGKALLLTNAQAREMYKSGEVEKIGSDSASWLGVPLNTPERTIGVLVVQSYDTEGTYSLQDLAFLTSVGDQIAIAIERKRSEEQLKLYNDKLQKSNRELQDFAYVASHDLQEPLRKVQAFSDRLKTRYSDKLEGEGLDYLERMRGAASRMQLLIQDLLTFSRVATNARPFAQVDLKEITSEVLSDLEIKIEETGAVVNTGDLPTIDADPLQMRQLLQNLVGNALKFRQHGQQPIINIYSQPAPANGKTSNGKFQLVVTDNGIGFDEKYTDKIFAVFQRLHGRTEYEGSGVGLSICRKIAERHNGNIAAKSKPNDGSTFIVTLPVRQAASEVI